MAGRTQRANAAWEALLRAERTIARELTAGDVWGELIPPEYGVLYALSTAPPEGLRITDLGNDVLLSQPGMSRLIARLETSGLVERLPDPDDRRASRVRLTDAGVRKQREVGRRHARDVEVAMARALSDEQLEQLRVLCSALIATPPSTT